LETIKYRGTIHFDPKNKTKKHINQSEWKKVALILFEGDICEYYSWFFKKNFHLYLNKPLRGAHVTFINDKQDSIKGNSLKDKLCLWNSICSKWENKKIELEFNLSPRSNAQHWWLNVSQTSRDELQEIRNELGLSTPFFGLHLTIGIANEKNLQHSDYIRKVLSSNLYSIL
jgi:hypothetical protein